MSDDTKTTLLDKTLPDEDEKIAQTDEQVADEMKPTGSMPNAEPMDIDETAESVGLKNDNNGPRELGSDET